MAVALEFGPAKKKKGLDKNESLPRVKKKTQRKERDKNRKKAKKKRRKKGGWKKKKKADGTEKNSEKKMDEIKGEKYYQKFNVFFY